MEIRKTIRLSMLLALAVVLNILESLIPVFNTIKKRPAEILSRTDIS